MSGELHRDIARQAVERGYLAMGEAVDIVHELGRRRSAGGTVEVHRWADEAWLTDDQLQTILDDLRPTDGTDSEEAPPSKPGIETRTDLGGPGKREGDDEIGSPAESSSPGAGNAVFETQEAIPPQTSEQTPDEEHWERNLTPTSDGENRGLAPSESENLEEYSEASPGEDTLTSIPDSLLEGEIAPLDLGGGDRNQPEEGAGAARDRDRIDDDSDGELLGAESTSSPEIPPIDASGQGPLLPAADRFVFDRELGSGGSGRVVRVYDRLIGRSVAMKILQSEVELDAEHLEQFIVEAQATGQLEHPNIVPVYDFGILGDGTPFYTMREVRGESLRDVLAQLREGEEYAHDDYTLVRLINLLRQVSQAVHYAHVRSVIHRDLKPGNIMLGDYGEVLVMDWGLARAADPGARADPSRAPDRAGYTLGTPSFMPPEQARGELEDVDESSDIYSLGAILYQMLTLTRPYTGTDPTDVMWKVIEADLPPPADRAPENRRVPEELERICRKAMCEDKRGRYGSVREFSEELEAWLEGLKPRRADQYSRQGKKAAERYQRLLKEARVRADSAREVESNLADAAPPDERKLLWELEDDRDEKRRASDRAFCEAVINYRQALAHDPGADDAEEGLADLYWTRMRRAERRGDDRSAVYFKALLEHHDSGKYADRLDEQINLSIESQPPGSVELAEYDRVDRRLRPTAPRRIGETPTSAEQLPFGRYLLKVETEDRPAVRRPVDVDRDSETEIDVALPPSSAYEPGFVYVPGGPFLAGGDPDAFDPRPPDRIDLEGFFCAEYPVTFGEYLEWFNELYDRRGDAVMEHAPQTRQSEGLLVRRDPETGRWVPDPILIEGAARSRYPEDAGHEFNLPVLGVRASDAEAYCDWRSDRDGRNYRLPSANELEKAGRGVDGRHFPWGNDFVETYCKMRDSRPENPPQPEPVGAFPEDVSPYGVRDLAGGVQEWCRSSAAHDDHRTVKGGSWKLDARLCRLASSIDMLDAARSAKLGFRLVYDSHQ